MVYAERRLAMVDCILVSSGDNPRRCILKKNPIDKHPKRYTILETPTEIPYSTNIQVNFPPRREQFKRTYEMEHFPINDKIMQAIHELFNARIPIVPMDVEDIDVIRA